MNFKVDMVKSLFTTIPLTNIIYRVSKNHVKGFKIHQSCQRKSNVVFRSRCNMIQLCVFFASELSTVTVNRALLQQLAEAYFCQSPQSAVRSSAEQEETAGDSSSSNSSSAKKNISAQSNNQPCSPPLLSSR